MNGKLSSAHFSCLLYPFFLLRSILRLLFYGNSHGLEKSCPYTWQQCLLSLRRQNTCKTLSNASRHFSPTSYRHCTYVKKNYYVVLFYYTCVPFCNGCSTSRNVFFRHKYIHNNIYKTVLMSKQKHKKKGYMLSTYPKLDGFCICLYSLCKKAKTHFL